MHTTQQIIWRKKLGEYDEHPNYAYVEKQYDQRLFLNVYFLKTGTVCN